MTTDLFDAGCYFCLLDAGYYLSNAVKMTIGYLCLGEDELKRVRYVSPWWFHCRWMNSWLGMWLVCGVCWWCFLFGVLFCCLLRCLVWGVWLVGMPCHSSCFSSYKSYEAQDGRSEMGTRPDA